MLQTLTIFQIISQIITESDEERYFFLESSLKDKMEEMKKKIKAQLFIDGMASRDLTNIYLKDVTLSIGLLYKEKLKLKKRPNLNNLEFKKMMRFGKILNHLVAFQETLGLIHQELSEQPSV